MLRFINKATRRMYEYILRYTWEAVQKFNPWKPWGAKMPGEQVMRFRTDGGGEYPSKNFGEYQNQRA